MAETKLTVTAASKIASSPEVMETMTVEEIQELIAVLSNSTDKKVTRKLNMVQAILDRKKAEATPDELEVIEQVENSVKEVTKVKVNELAQQKAHEVAAQKVTPKAEAGTEQATLPLGEEPTTPQEGETSEVELEVILQADMKGLSDIAAQYDVQVTPEIIKAGIEAVRGYLAEQVLGVKLEVEQVVEEEEVVIPATFEHEGTTYASIEFGELQGATLQHVYKVLCLVKETGNEVVTPFLVTYANDEVVVLLDLAIEVNSVVPLSVKSFNPKKGTVKLDGKQCPYGLFVPQS